MHTLIIRNDLNMRRGKMAAQSSHALMKAILNCFDSVHGGNALHLNESHMKQLIHWKNSPKVQARLVSDLSELSKEAEKHSGESLFVEDLGRTEFHGQKTTTCACLVDPQWVLSMAPRIPKPFNEPLKAKQVIAIRRDEKLSKESMCEFASIASVDGLLNGFNVTNGVSEYDLEQDTPLAVWLRTAFGKIVVGVPNGDVLHNIANQAHNEGVIVGTASNDEGRIMAVSIGPDFPDQIDPLTGDFKLL